MICPDPSCQKQVVKDNKKQTDRYNALKRKSKQRAIDRRASVHGHKTKK